MLLLNMFFSASATHLRTITEYNLFHSFYLKQFVAQDLNQQYWRLQLIVQSVCFCSSAIIVQWIGKDFWNQIMAKRRYSKGKLSVFYQVKECRSNSRELRYHDRLNIHS
jgi:hypothetical protein